ncbi:MAG: DNA-3-methyladenine glycosylase [Opitutaceae bacterium]|nr:DNA-3-methyladenine glycosylase [Opitutaceae bacterium]
MRSQQQSLILTPEHFKSADTVSLARSLLGKYLVLKKGSSYMITEVEAYDGPTDLACHASHGRTKRTETLFSQGGIWYVYLIYGIHEMLNLVTGPEDYPAALLIRGLEGVSGPGRLTKALDINRRFNGKKASPLVGLHLEDRGTAIASKSIQNTPRIGVNYAGPIWSQKKYRFLLT